MAPDAPACALCHFFRNVPKPAATVLHGVAVCQKHLAEVIDRPESKGADAFRRMVAAGQPR
ncbi:hypothetical protein GCM10025862_37900 [Arsenicicoccus piscis]|uniref:Uncharacterized protein n=1 Tax=Arsenicicoccus piscis TaxID=673954 RepID=A0ABQ6HW58_9MICO|nr:hypothetical protein GCM10025862_37900 [Arsenicicoccus piscis]